MTDSALVAAVNRLATAVEQNTLALLDTRATSLEPLVADAGLPMGDEEPPLPLPPMGQGAPAYTTVVGQFPPISGPVQTQTIQQPVTQVVSPVPAMPPGLCPEHHQPWSKFVPAGVSKSGPNAGKTYAAFWACPEKYCKQRPPR